MDCKFLKVGSDKQYCSKKPVKGSVYCHMHKFIMKNDKTKPCLHCGKRTCSKLQICNKCGANNLRVKRRYHTVIKPFNDECKRLMCIDID